MRFFLPLLLLTIVACTPDATRVRLVNNTAFNLENGELSFGGEAEEIRFLAAGDDSSYFRFDGADDCDRSFTAELQSFGDVMNNNEPCLGPQPIAPGKYSLVLAFEATTNADGTISNGVFLRLRED